MAEYSGGMTATIAGTALRPIYSIAGTSTVSGIVVSFWLYNTTAVACEFRLVRFTGGTAGAGQTEVKARLNSPASTCALSAGHTADVTITEDVGDGYILPAAIGAGGVFSLGAGIETPTAGTTPGLGLVAVGTGQICRVGFRYFE